MPEKPEVITVANALKKQIIGKKIKEAEVLWNNIIAKPSVSLFKKKLVGEEIIDITTRGKFIVIILNNYVLLIHLRMEGKFFFRKKGDELNKHEHVIIRFTDNVEMRFHDTRKFGKMYLLDKVSYLSEKPIVDLGLEYNDKSLNDKYLFDRLKNKSIPIKTSLLDQSIITGIGNIYDDEILFLSGISPLRKSKDVKLSECKKIIDNTKIVLNKAVKKGGTTIKSFTSSEGVHGLFQNELLVHGKKNSTCPNCGKEIEVIRVGGRGTYYCKHCQK